MKPLLILLLTMGGILGATGGEKPSPPDFYIQLVRGTSDKVPPMKSSQAIGPKLAAQLKQYGAWKYYWEVLRQEVKIKRGEKKKLRLNQDREIEIDLFTSGKRIITVYVKSQVLSQTTDSLTCPMSIIGGERDRDTSWFIVVRPDKPSIK